jgi:DNA-binding IclR family transcriptional regulator
MYHETANLVILHDLSVIYLEKVESPLSIAISTLVGGRQPLHCTAVGKAILANLSSEILKDKISRMELTKFTSNTICDKKTLIESLENIKKKGYAEDFEELEIGLHCIAAPILNHNNMPFAAISISGPTSRMNEDLCREIGLSLVQYTREISQKLGFI